MHEVILYTLPGCPHCASARKVLRRHGIEFEEISGAGIRGFRGRLLERTGKASVPQVVIRGEPIGGADALLYLARRGVLTARVREEPFPQPVVRRRLSLRRLFGALAAAIAEVAATRGGTRSSSSTATGERSSKSLSIRKPLLLPWPRGCGTARAS